MQKPSVPDDFNHGVSVFPFVISSFFWLSFIRVLVVHTGVSFGRPCSCDKMAKPPDKAGRTADARPLASSCLPGPRSVAMAMAVFLCSWLPFSANGRSLGWVAAFVARFWSVPLLLCPCVLAVLCPLCRVAFRVQTTSSLHFFFCSAESMHARPSCTCALAVYLSNSLGLHMAACILACGTSCWDVFGKLSFDFFLGSLTNVFVSCGQ